MESRKHRNPRCFRNIGQIGKRGYDVKRINTIMGSKWSVRSYKRSFLKKTGNENRKKGNKNFAELFTLRICAPIFPAMTIFLLFFALLFSVLYHSFCAMFTKFSKLYSYICTNYLTKKVKLCKINTKYNGKFKKFRRVNSSANL